MTDEERARHVAVAQVYATMALAAAQWEMTHPSHPDLGMTEYTEYMQLADQELELAAAYVELVEADADG